MTTYLSLLILFVVLLLIAARRLGRLRVRIWQAMTFGALAVLLTGGISPLDALQAIHPDVMLFLFGVFVVGRALVQSGCLYTLSDHVLGRARTADGLLLLILFGGGFASALLMNDTLAIVGTPLVLALAREHGLPPKLLLLTLAFAITTGSVASPIGNPQNLLIAGQGGIENPFVDFLWYLGLPTLLALAAAYGILKLLHRRDLHARPLVHRRVEHADRQLALLARIALIVLLVMVMLKIALVVLRLPFTLPLSAIALAAAAPLLLFSRERVKLLKGVEWTTLLFFAAMFVLMAAVWNTGVLQKGIDGMALDLAGLPSLFAIGIGLSQLISNVPLVALYLPVLEHAGAGTPALMALAAASTIAGNLFIIGAASNVIIVESAERQGETLTFIDFARIGVPLTIVQAGIYYVFFSWIG
ncbi:MAG: SLC13 family permease [Chromatiales bacterium]|nr:SLC13 family permease [Chromatiales bacterium]